MPKFIEKNKRNITNSHYTPIQDFLKARDFYWNRLWRIVDGKIYAKLRWQWIRGEIFDAKFKPNPPVSFTLSEHNADRTREYLK